MTASTTGALNAIVDVTRQAVERSTAAAHVTFRADALPQGAVGSTVRARQHTVAVDEPPTLGGEDTAINPVETYLAALLSCQVVTYRFYAERLGVTIDELDLSAEGDLDVRGFFGLADDLTGDEVVRPGFSAVRVNVRIVGPDSAERYQELTTTVDAHCPVLDLTANPTPVTTTLQVA
ncbi:OsmC family protein [Tsukamurella sp. 8F]|uniref:OsmC family protein n=1 Tax=unclassified Tsukamurella TaxID=2633480 RepID=UPI0023B90172|nr:MULTISPECIES: OsmC family protein [unclassified Tsukamurella]MDF0530864.1 OsmC family protein [Tsukamurella sp. 8J]MDF0588191.1 OsmC family protein [Tsukamurella sp. 8F]